MHEATMGDDFDYPSGDHDETWHVHADKTWGWGISCDECRKPRRGSEYAHTLPRFNIRHLQTQNVLGQTVAEMERDIIGDADPDKIDRVR